MEALAEVVKNPLGGVGFLLFILSIVSVWINRRIWIWGPLFVASYILAYFGGVLDLKTIPVAVILFLCHAALTQEIKGFWRLFAVMIASVISFGLITHYVQGFHNIRLLQNWQSGSDSVPISIYLNYDKPLVAIFILGLSLPLLQTKKNLIRCLIFTVPWTILTIVVILGLAKHLQLVNFAWKIPSITLIWLIIQLFFVVIPEEVFFRGFIQREIARGLNNTPIAGALAVLVTALLFTLVHFFFLPHAGFLFATFVTTLFYGTIYQITGYIESSIFTHFITNVVHFFFFTYPMLAPVISGAT